MTPRSMVIQAPARNGSESVYNLAFGIEQSTFFPPIALQTPKAHRLDFECCNFCLVYNMHLLDQSASNLSLSGYPHPSFSFLFP